MMRRLWGEKRKGTAKRDNGSERPREREKENWDVRYKREEEWQWWQSTALENWRARVKEEEKDFPLWEEWSAAGEEKRMTSAYDTRISARQ